MSEEVNIDEAANTALLLEQHIEQKLAKAVIDVFMADAMPRSPIPNLHRYAEDGNFRTLSSEIRNWLALDMMQQYSVRNSLAHMIREEIRQSHGMIVEIVRAELQRARMGSTLMYNTNSTHPVAR